MLSSNPSVPFTIQYSITWLLDPHNVLLIAESTGHFTVIILDFYIHLTLLIIHFSKFCLSWTTVIEYTAHSPCIFMTIPFLFPHVFVPPHALNSGDPKPCALFTLYTFCRNFILCCVIIFIYLCNVVLLSS